GIAARDRDSLLCAGDAKLNALLGDERNRYLDVLYRACGKALGRRVYGIRTDIKFGDYKFAVAVCSNGTSFVGLLIYNFDSGSGNGCAGRIGDRSSEISERSLCNCGVAENGKQR